MVSIAHALDRPEPVPVDLGAATPQESFANQATGQPTPPLMKAWERGLWLSEYDAVMRAQWAFRLPRYDRATGRAHLTMAVIQGWLVQENGGYRRSETDPVPWAERPKEVPITVRYQEGFTRRKRVQLPSGEWVETLELESVPERFFDHHTGQEVPRPKWWTTPRM